MHDTILTQKICRQTAALCAQSGIGVIRELRVSVHPKSHVTESSLLEGLKECGKSLVSADTRAAVLRDLDEEGAAEIRTIEGVYLE